MIGYGLAFVIGWVLCLCGTIINTDPLRPWNLDLLVWGLAFAVLNWVATLG